MEEFPGLNPQEFDFVQPFFRRHGVMAGVFRGFLFRKAAENADG
jgi:hypothetical protein